MILSTIASGLSLLTPISGGEIQTAFSHETKLNEGRVEQRTEVNQVKNSLIFTLNKNSTTLANAIHLQSGERTQWMSAACGCASCASLSLVV
jgi:hypothetical protein